MSNNPFALRVTEGMRRQGTTLRGLCRAADLDPSFFSKVLSGKRSPPASEFMLRRIAKILKLDAAELVVAAGSIPWEWKAALCNDPALFQDIHRRAYRKNYNLHSGHSPARPATPVMARRDLSEELL